MNHVQHEPLSNGEHGHKIVQKWPQFSSGGQ